MTQQYCIHGHDTHVVGRKAHGECAECARAVVRSWYAAHRESAVAVTRAYYAAHRSESNAKRRDWHLANVERDRIKLRRWALANSGRRDFLEKRRRARRAGNGGSHTWKEWLEKLELHAGCCFYCGEPGKMTQDHAVPLSRGGSDDISNILPACFSCNSRKHTKTALEFMALRREQWAA